MATQRPAGTEGDGSSVPADGRLLTVAEVSALLRAHPNSVRRWADMGLLPVYRIGQRGDRRFKPDDVAAFLNARRRG